jgi:hypothetical protein
MVFLTHLVHSNVVFVMKRAIVLMLSVRIVGVFPMTKEIGPYNQGRIDLANELVEWIFHAHAHHLEECNERPYVDSLDLEKYLRNEIARLGGKFIEWWVK